MHKTIFLIWFLTLIVTVLAFMSYSSADENNDYDKKAKRYILATGVLGVVSFGITYLVSNFFELFTITYKLKIIGLLLVSALAITQCGLLYESRTLLSKSDTLTNRRERKDMFLAYSVALAASVIAIYRLVSEYNRNKPFLSFDDVFNTNMFKTKSNRVQQELELDDLLEQLSQ